MRGARTPGQISFGAPGFAAIKYSVAVGDKDENGLKFEHTGQFYGADFSSSEAGPGVKKIPLIFYYGLPFPRSRLQGYFVYAVLNHDLHTTLT